MDIFKELYYKYRIRKAVNKWNKDIPYIKKCIEEDDKILPENKESGENYRPHRSFYWKQLVWQEIKMYIQIGKQVELSEFTWLCNSRGFSLNEQNYLQTMLEYVGLLSI